MCSAGSWMQCHWLLNMEGQIIFLTMTCNPYWPEITELLLPSQTPQDRPNIVAMVYHAKLIDFCDFVIKKGYFGKVAA